eukprot:TRINITY_DN3247_c0_g1_i1.p1 TRINITY_DN3247_c0_g1~~TRINITY_DN3247_c0_g1_i1.p1  ORF type:complete len:303 (-),score=72.16 TRINITY_DN3247_c0_g1_i1:221-1129(-)
MAIDLDWIESILFLKIYTLISFLFNLFLFIICSDGKLGQKSTLDTWNLYNSSLTLSSWSHSFWWILFVIQGCYTVYLFIPVRYNEKKEILTSFGIWLPLAWNLYTAWTVVFSFQLVPLSLAFIAAHWVILFVSYNNINNTYENKLDVLVYGETNPRTGEKIPLEKKERAWVIVEFLITYLPTSFHLGWVTLLTVVNLSTVSSFGHHQLYASLEICMLFLVSLIVFIVAAQRLDPLLCLPVIWGLASLARSTEKRKNYISVSSIVLAGVLAGISVMISVYLLLRNLETRKIHEQQRLLKDERV